MAITALVPSDGGVGATLDLTNGAILLEQAVSTPFYTRTAGDRFPNGYFALGNNGAGNGPLSVWSWQGGVAFTKIATVGSPSGQTSTWPAVTANGRFIWGADTSGGINTPTFRKIDQTGAVITSVGPISSIANGIQAMATSFDETVMYYASSLSGTPIRRWDLVNNVALSNLVTPTDPVVGIWAIPGSTDIAVVTQTVFSGVSAVNDTIIRYTTAAAVVYSRVAYTEPSTATDTTIEIGRDISLTSIWVRTPAAPSYLQTTSSVYINLDLLAGGELSRVTIAVNADGAPTSTCPFILLGNVGAKAACSSFT